MYRARQDWLWFGVRRVWSTWVAIYGVESHTFRRKFRFLFSAPYASTTRFEEGFFSLKTMERKINYKRLTAEPAPEGFICMCACTEPDKTGFGSVCVEYGRPKWPNTMLNHTHSEECFVFYFLAPYAPTARYEEAFFSLGNNEKKGSLRSRASWLHRWPGPPLCTLWASKNPSGDIEQCRTARKVSTTSQLGAPNGVLHCSMSPQMIFSKPTLWKEGVPATCVRERVKSVWGLSGNNYTLYVVP